jgi:hypothetical protein
MPQAGVISVSRALPPGPTNPRNCLEITLVFNGCDPAFLQSCYHRPELASHPTVACGFSPSNALFLLAVDKLARDDDRGENGHRRRTFQAKNGEGKAGNSRI